MKHRPFPFGTAVWTVILLAWSLAVLYLLTSGTVLLYLHPRMRIFLGFGGAMFLILAVSTALGAFREGGSRRPRAGYAIFLVPLVLAAAAGPRPLSARSARNRLLRGEAPSPLVIPLQPEAARTLQNILDSAEAGSVVRIEDYFHAAMAEDMMANPVRYQGRRLSLVGFAHRTTGLPRNRVFITRFLITCCPADAEPVGILATWPGAADLSGGEWMRVTGTVEPVVYTNPYTGRTSTIAMIRVEKIVPGEMPEVVYLYPSQL